MTNIFYDYINKIRDASPETLKTQMPQWLETLKQSLLDDQKKPVDERAINATFYKESDKSWSRPIKITPLQFAMQTNIASGRLREIINLYIEYSDLSVSGENGHALHYAVMYSSYLGIDLVKTLVKLKPELVSIPSSEGSFVLSTAAAFDKQGDCLEFLLKEGKANIDIKNKNQNGWTALHQAVYMTNNRAVVLLLENGASTQVVDSGGSKPTEIGHYYSSGLYNPSQLSEKVRLDHAAKKEAAESELKLIKQHIVNVNRLNRSEVAVEEFPVSPNISQSFKPQNIPNTYTGLDDLIKQEIIRLFSSKSNQGNFLVSIGLIEASDEKILALTKLKEILSSATFGDYTPEDLEITLRDWKDSNYECIAKQRNCIHSFFSPKHKSTAAIAVDSLFMTLNINDKNIQTKGFSL